MLDFYEEVDVIFMNEDEIVGIDRIDTQLCESLQAFYQEQGYFVVMEPVQS